MIRYINVKSRSRNEFIDITRDVESEMAETGVRNGMCYVYVPHTTAAITINEGADPSVKSDILQTLSRLVPHVTEYYKHMEGNSDAHVKSSLVGVSVSIPVEDGKLILGTWQSLYFCEFDGPRHRRVALQFVSVG
jgi:secondary thiamine-phosphate synthase enzyme